MLASTAITYTAIGLRLSSVVAVIGDNPTSKSLVKFMTEMKTCELRARRGVYRACRAAGGGE